MKTLLILLGTAFGANLGFPSNFLGYHDYTSGLFDPIVGPVRRIRDTNVIDTNDEQFSEDFRKYDKDRDGINDGADNCVNDPNADQLDTDEDGMGDECEQTVNHFEFVNTILQRDTYTSSLSSILQRGAVK